MWTLSASLLLLLLLNSATLFNLKESDNSEEECSSEPDVRHRLEKKNLHKMSHLHCTEGKHTFELVMDEAGSRSRDRIPKKEKPQHQQGLKSSFEKDEIVSGDQMKKWYKRMGLY